jgi:uncharacterized OB-fold protein
MTKLAPKLTPVNRPFWEGCNRQRLMLQRCVAEACGRYVFYPRICCPHCGSGELAWEQVSGKARVRSFTVVHHPLNEALLADAPYIFAAVTLEEGPTMYTRLDVDPSSTDGLMDHPVEVVFKNDQVPGQQMPFFRLAK